MARIHIKKYILTLLLFVIPCSLMAKNNAQPQYDNNNVKVSYVVLNQMKQEIYFNKTEVKRLQSQLASSKAKIDSLDNKLKELQSDVKTNQVRTKEKIKTTNITIEKIRNSIRDKATIFCVLLVCIVFSIFAIALLLKKKLRSHSDSLNDTQQAVKNLKDNLQNIEEGTVSLDDKVTDILDKYLSLPQPVNQDHSLALKVADEIVRIETNLYRMDPSTRGYKQLTRSVQRMKDCFMTKGYEISDLLGKPYNEGMKVVANFVVDETLPEGEAIITGVIKPQIIYNGKMIQAAQITVSQNI